jgi:hypothetical protein
MRIMMRYFLLMLLSFALTFCGGPEPPEQASQIQKPTPVQVAEQTETLSVPTTINQQTNPNDPIVATWKGGQLRLAEIDKILRQQKSQVLLNASQDPKIKEMLLKNIPSERREVIVTLIENNLLAQEAQKDKVTVTPAKKEELVKNFRLKFKTEDEYKASLVQSGYTDKDLEDMLVNIYLARVYMTKQQEAVKKYRY